MPSVVLSAEQGSSASLDSGAGADAAGAGADAAGAGAGHSLTESVAGGGGAAAQPMTMKTEQSCEVYACERI